MNEGCEESQGHGCPRGAVLKVFFQDEERERRGIPSHKKKKDQQNPVPAEEDPESKEREKERDETTGDKQK